MATCARCGEESPDGFRFCGACGAPLEHVAAARQERKVVTVVYADLVGSTARAERLDPEDVRAVLAPFHRRLREELEHYGGVVEKFIGDAVVGLFGAPVAHEDDPERAVRAALSIQDAIAQLNEEDPGLELEVRVGVATGDALVALDAGPDTGEGMAAGDVMNTGARLQAAAPPGGVLVGEATYRATVHVVDYEATAPVVAKGKARPLLAWRAIAPRSRLGVDVRQHGAARLVGRRRELELVRGALERVRSERELQLVTIVGVPGIGKSRLVFETLRAVESEEEVATWRQGRCLPYGDGVAFWALGEMVKAHAGILETDSSADAERKLRDAVAHVAPDEGDRLERHLRPLVGLPSDESGGDRSAEAFAAWRRFFEAIAEQRPLVLVFEDLHWAEEQLLDFVGHLVDWAQGVPLLVLCTARPELLQRRPTWGGGALNAATIALSPLSAAETGELLAALGEGTLDDAAIQTVLAKAEGNPLYAEQFARMVAVQGDLGAALPETVQGIIAARIDGLPADQKQLLQRAAVIGKVFWTGAVAALATGEADAVELGLHGLVRQEFIRRERRSSVGGETEYAFRHALVRDVAYGQIPRAERATLHGRAAKWIESLSERVEDLAELRAHHWSNAAELARLAGLETPELEARARDALVDAGEHAYALSALAQAERAFTRALDLWPDDGSPERARLRARRELVRLDAASTDVAEAGALLEELLRHELHGEAAVVQSVLNWSAWNEGRLADLEAGRRRVEELVAGQAPSREVLIALSSLARGYVGSRDPEPGLPRALALLELARSVGEERIELDALTTIGTLRVMVGDEGGYAQLEDAARRLGDRGSVQVIRALKNAGSLRVDAGSLDEGFRLQGEGLRAARHFGIPYEVTWFTGERAIENWWRGRWDDAVADADAVLAASAREPHFMAAVGVWVRALVRLARDDVGRAHADSAEGLRLARAHGGQVSIFPRVARIHTCLAVGEEDEAHAAADEILAYGAVDWPSGTAGAFAALGRGGELLARPPAPANAAWEEAGRAYLEGDYVAAAVRYRAIGALPEEADARVRAGEQLLAGGEAAGRAEVERALAFWRSVDALGRIREAEALLAAV